jgi:hypothetical protein
MLTPEEQDGMVQDAPDVFLPVSGYWGKHGWTRVLLESVAPDILEAALHTAWQNRVAKNAKPKKPAKSRKASNGV